MRGVGGIRHAALRLRGRFIAITGESGAGKSSLIRAVEFLCGKRPQISFIHGDCDGSDVDAVFESLQAADGDTENLIVSRSLSRASKGSKSRATIQGRPVTVTELTDSLAPLVEIQSQFAQLELLLPQKQLELVDGCGLSELVECRMGLQERFRELLKLERELHELREWRQEVEKRYADTEPLLRQIESLQLAPDSETRWEEEIREIERRIRVAEYLTGLEERLCGGEDGGIVAELERLCRDMSAASSLLGFTDDWMGEAETALQHLQVFSRELGGRSNACGDIAEENAHYEEIEEKLGLLRRLKRDSGCRDVQSLLEYVREAREEMALLVASRVRLEETEERVKELRKEVSSAASQLRVLRRQAALKLQERVNAHLKDLAMEDFRFDVQVHPAQHVRENGAEFAQFSLGVRGLDPAPVAKIASGGELSRLLIAIQVSCEQEQLPSTLVFDEVEAGLGGRAALLAGEKLRELSSRCQTLLITHEATLAALADQHFLVERVGDDTKVREIEGEERVVEIARMLSGDPTSQSARAHARTLLDSAQRNR